MKGLEGPERAAAAVAAMSWEMLEPVELAAAYFASTFPGKIPPHNLAYAKALKLGLIEADGSMHELVKVGLEVAVSRFGEEEEP